MRRIEGVGSAAPSRATITHRLRVDAPSRNGRVGSCRSRRFCGGLRHRARPQRRLRTGECLWRRALDRKDARRSRAPAASQSGDDRSFDYTTDARPAAADAAAFRAAHLFGGRRGHARASGERRRLSPCTRGRRWEDDDRRIADGVLRTGCDRGAARAGQDHRLAQRKSGSSRSPPPVRHGAHATLSVAVATGTTCSITVHNKSGASVAAGLVTKRSAASLRSPFALSSAPRAWVAGSGRI